MTTVEKPTTWNVQYICLCSECQHVRSVYNQPPLEVCPKCGEPIKSVIRQVYRHVRTFTRRFGICWPGPLRLETKSFAYADQENPQCET